MAANLNLARTLALAASATATLVVFQVPVTRAQSGVPAPQLAAEKFEVASVKPSPPPGPGWRTVGCQGGPGTSDPGLFTCREITISNLISMAFHLEEYQFPNRDAIDNAPYEISARVPPNSTRDQFDRMLQTLLFERCKLTFHWQRKDMVVYNLVVAKGGLKMKPSPPQDQAETSEVAPPPQPAKPELDADGFPKVAPAQRGGISVQRFDGRGRWATVYTSTRELAGTLAFFSGNPVVDTTELAGKYDFTLSWVYDPDKSAAVPPNLTGPTLAEAIEQQLGLRLERKKGTAEVFIVDHIERPAGN
jgi:uncharacterized protein (TIGR03435 family)